MKNEMKKMEENIVELIHDEDYEGGGTPLIITAVTAVTNLLGITSACTRACWHPGK